ncbi:hypothetical protein C8D87_103618 [Lentzea atacamensis]|uniref:PEP-CTERM protein-sorting domain-containing protein n=1 Tax=Lentzea atacamensis TaxID=531938 RepID=A0ABX9EAU8_9PSEU|nr:hypothetical protein C8D87_103618 [Lentzea atacamensis]
MIAPAIGAVAGLAAGPILLYRGFRLARRRRAN